MKIPPNWFDALCDVVRSVIQDAESNDSEVESAEGVPFPVEVFHHVRLNIDEKTLSAYRHQFVSPVVVDHLINELDRLRSLLEFGGCLRLNRHLRFLYDRLSQTKSVPKDFLAQLSTATVEDAQSLERIGVRWWVWNNGCSCSRWFNDADLDITIREDGDSAPYVW